MDYLAKWHRELGIFCRIKPLIIVEGNVLDVYQYPVDGSTPKGSILRLSEYLHFFFKDMGYKNIIFFDSLKGFYNTCEEGYLDGRTLPESGRADPYPRRNRSRRNRWLQPWRRGRDRPDPSWQS